MARHPKYPKDRTQKGGKGGGGGAAGASMGAPAPATAPPAAIKKQKQARAATGGVTKRPY